LGQRACGTAIFHEVAQLGLGKGGTGRHHDALCSQDSEVSDDEAERITAAEDDSLPRAESLSLEPSSRAGGEAVELAVGDLLPIDGQRSPLGVLYRGVVKQLGQGPLDELRTWLTANNATVVAVLLLVIGTVILGKGIGGL